jgi:predicted glycoside hydrolase/deacetylase ChbG (UPF0249 family)
VARVDTVSSLVESQDPWWPLADGQVRGRDYAHVYGGNEKVLHMRGKCGLRQALGRCEISLEEVGREVEAQIAVFKQLTGAAPVYLDGHQHVHVLPGIAAVVARVAQREAVKFVRMPDEPAENFEGHVGAVRTAFYKCVTSQAADARDIFRDEGLVAPDEFMGLGLMGADLNLERLHQRLTRVLHAAAAAVQASLPAKFSEAAAEDLAASVSEDCCQHQSVKGGAGSALAREWRWSGGGQVYVAEYMCHVGKASALGDDFNMSSDRDSELRVLSHPSLRPWLLAHHIALTSYQELAKLWPTSDLSGLLETSDSDNCPRGACVGIAQELPNGGASRRGDVDAASLRMVAASTSPLLDAATLRMDINGDETVAKRRVEETGMKRLARSGRLLILSSMTAATGNATTALRLASVALVMCAPTLCLPLLSRLSLRLPPGTR